MNPADELATIERVPPSQARRRVLVGLAVVLRREGSASIREVGAACKLTSTSSVAYQLNKLAESGHVEQPIRNRPRGWRLTPLGWTAAESVVTELRTVSGRGKTPGTVRR